MIKINELIIMIIIRSNSVDLKTQPAEQRANKNQSTIIFKALFGVEGGLNMISKE